MQIGAPSGSRGRRRLFGFVAVLPLAAVTLLLLIQLKLHSAMRNASTQELSVAFTRAYSIIPGTIEVRGLEITSRARPHFRLTAERVTLEQSLTDYLTTRRHFREVRVMGATLRLTQREHPSAQGADRTGTTLLGIAPDLSAAGASAPPPTLFSTRRIDVAFRSIATPRAVIEGPMQASARDVWSATGKVMRMASLEFRMRGARLLREPLEAARGLDGSIRLHELELPFASTQSPSMQAAFELTAARVQHPWLETQGPLRLIGELELNDGQIRELIASAQTAPTATLGADVAPVVFSDGFKVDIKDDEGPLAMYLASANAAFQVDVRTFSSPVRLASEMHQVGTSIRSASGSVVLAQLKSRSWPQDLPPIELRVDLERAALAEGQLAATGRVHAAGRELRSLLELMNLPEAARLMLTRFQRESFQAEAMVFWEPEVLTLRELRATSGDLQIRGVLRRTEAAHRAAFAHSTAAQQLGRAAAPEWKSAALESGARLAAIGECRAGELSVAWYGSRTCRV